MVSSTQEVVMGCNCGLNEGGNNDHLLDSPEAAF
jgi:hypothetical protein